MSHTTTPKKPASVDWHPADIVAALRKAGWSTRRLAKHHGYHPTTVAKAMHQPYPQAERLIADALGVEPETIWPERFAARAKDTTRTRRNAEGRSAAA